MKRNSFFSTINFPRDAQTNSLADFSLTQLQSTPVQQNSLFGLRMQANHAQQVVNNTNFKPLEHSEAQRAADDLARKAFLSSLPGPR